MIRTLSAKTSSDKEWCLFVLLFSIPVCYFLFAGSRSLMLKDAPVATDQARIAIALTQRGWEPRKENPVIPGDFADPSVIRAGNVYYATGTSSEWAPHFPLFRSTDLLHWQPAGYVFPKTPAWAAASFWAPELFYWKGTYYVYYVARKKSDGISCIGVATSRDPGEGFTDRGIILEFGKEAIDAFVIEDNGKLYITWKAYGLDQRPIEILGSRLSDDGLKLEGETFSLLRDDEKQGLEGQCLVKRDGFFYIFYSPGNCCGSRCSYKVEVARSASVRGPYTKFANNPILAETDDWKCTGHGTLVTTNEGKDFYMYHAYSKSDDVYTGRQGMLGEVIWDKQTGWPAVKPVGDEIDPPKSFQDEFSTPELSGAWQWDFRHAELSVKIERGNLILSGQPTADNQAGTAITVRPTNGNYEITTEVVNRNASLKGLVLYGDAGQSVGIGVKDNVVQVWEVKKNQRSILMEKHIGGNPVQLKMKVDKGYQIRFYWGKKESGWNQLSINDTYYNGNFLPQWDRSPRVGLLHQGNQTDAAVFSFFNCKY